MELIFISQMHYHREWFLSWRYSPQSWLLFLGHVSVSYVSLKGGYSTEHPGPLGHQVGEQEHVFSDWEAELSPSLTGFDTSILPICKDSLGWMFNKLDMNYDLLLDHSEINAIYLDKYEPCIKPLFNSCDSFKDGKLSNNEWCYCFQKPGGKEVGLGGLGGKVLGHGGWQPCWARRPAEICAQKGTGIKHPVEWQASPKVPVCI